MRHVFDHFGYAPEPAPPITFSEEEWEIMAADPHRFGICGGVGGIDTRGRGCDECSAHYYGYDPPDAYDYDYDDIPPPDE